MPRDSNSKLPSSRSSSDAPNGSTRPVSPRPDARLVQTTKIQASSDDSGDSEKAQWEGPKVGTLIDNTYRVVGPLGQGGMGLVVLAVDERLQREVAVKFIRPHLVSSQKARERFLTEARAMARVRHENVVEIYAFGEIQGVPYFVMENVPGSTIGLWLLDATGADALPPIDEALGFIDQVCRGLSAIHASDTVHGDLKPNNVLIGPASRVAIADLGMSRALGQIGKQGELEIGGTPAYMAPELTRPNFPQQLACRADIYSLGVMAFEMLTGRSPYDVQNVADLVAIHKQKPPKPSDLRPELTTKFDEALLNAVRTDPIERTASADDFRRALLQARDTITSSYDASRILVADDDPDFSALAREILSYSFPGAQIECVGDGDAALEAIDRNPASLAVIDLDMPGMNGVELTAALRGSEASRHLPIIVVTAAGGAPDWTLLSALGADGFLVKPIDPFALVALARKTLGGITHG